MDSKLPEDKLNMLLPALSLLAENIGERNELDEELFLDILLSVGAEKDEWAFEEIGTWSKILIKARDSFDGSFKNTAVIELKDRGIPEFPSMLSVYMVTNHEKEFVTGQMPNTASLKKMSVVDKPVEMYHQRLPDHGWHNDLTWEQLPDWIKQDAELITKLQRGGLVVGRSVSYKLMSNKLIRRLNDSIPYARRVKNLTQQINTYVERHKPAERYNQRLPDHEWHNDLTWEQLPDWIKKDAKLKGKLRRGEEIIGQRVRYKLVANKLIRRLRHKIPVTYSASGHKTR